MLWLVRCDDGTVLYAHALASRCIEWMQQHEEMISNIEIRKRTTVRLVKYEKKH